jgi:hypothetical protein
LEDKKMPVTCFPIAQGVPGGLSGAPNWYDDSASPPRPYDEDTDDPRWRGAFAHSFGSGTIEEVSFRGLNGTEASEERLYLSWLIKADPTGPADSQLYVGLGNSDAGAAIIVNIGMTTSSNRVASSDYSIDVHVRPAGASDYSASGVDPAWITAHTRVWVTYTPETTPSLSWAVEMVIPLNEELSPDPTHSVILDSADNFKMWYAAYLGFTPGDGDIIEYTWPGTPGIGTGYPLPADFVDVRAADSTSDPACTAEGISISRLNIGVKNVDGSDRASASRIQVDLSDPPTADEPDEQNLFFADPDFPAGTPTTEQEAVRAHFRLANWGSHVGDLTSTSWTTVPGGDAVSFDAGAGECRFVWPTPADLASGTPSRQLIDDLRTGVKTTHQCMLVELSSVHPSATFLINSVYRNMDFVTASKFARPAEISLRIPGAGSTPRDVYLYEHTYNMPAFIPPQEGEDEGPEEWDEAEPVERRRGRDHPARRAARMAARPAAFQRKRMRVEDLVRWVPTYAVLVYRDTGRTTTLFDGTPRRILQPQSSFGYFVGHEGNLYGWKHSIEGAQRIARRWYKLSVPENGARQIKTLIEADEAQGCLHALFALFQKLLTAIREG